MITATQQILNTAHGLQFTTDEWGGNWTVLVSETADGTWVINDDFGISFYPGQTWTEDDSEPTVTADFENVEYDDETGDVANLAEFAAWCAAFIASPDATEADADRDARAKTEGYAAGIAAYAERGDLNHYVMADLAVSTAHATFSERGSARTIYAYAFGKGYHEAQHAAKGA